MCRWMPCVKLWGWIQKLAKWWELVQDMLKDKLKEVFKQVKKDENIYKH
jgi:hypothetical protein